MNHSLTVASLLLVTACTSSSEGDGELNVLLESEDVIANGLEAGDELENVRDGWSVSFDTYVLAIGNVSLELTSDEATHSDAVEVLAVDLTSLESDGLPLWEIGGLGDGRWQFGYSVTPEGMQQHSSVTDAEFNAMVDNEWSALIEGEISQSGGQSCPPSSLADVPEGAESIGENAAGDLCYANEKLTFSWGFHVKAAFGPCEIDGVSGVAVSSGSTSTAAITIHGDHLFFNGFPEGDEGGVMRLAQWIADCDLDLDGEVTLAELAAVTPGDLVAIDDRYQLGGSPLTPIDNMRTYMEAQIMTQGHFQGEGECALNGISQQEH